MTRSVLSGTSASGLAFPSRGGRFPVDGFRRFLSKPIPSFDGGTCELLDVLRGLPTRASSSVIRVTSRSIISCCWINNRSFSRSVSRIGGGNAIHRVNQIHPHQATPFCQPREQLRRESAPMFRYKASRTLAGRKACVHITLKRATGKVTQVLNRIEGLASAVYMGRRSGSDGTTCIRIGHWPLRAKLG